eukprot:scaffold138569_cov127-Phaeocystis_antarctica.AAC.1
MRALCRAIAIWGRRRAGRGCTGRRGRRGRRGCRGAEVQSVQRAQRVQREQRVQVDADLVRVDVDGQHGTRGVGQRLLDDVAAAAAERVDHEEPAPRRARPSRDVRREPLGRHRKPALCIHPHASVELREELSPP